MIKSFGDKDTERIWNGSPVKKYSADLQKIARRKLRMINNAQSLNDLRVPPANHLEKLQGDLSDYWSIRINNQWRIIFRWIDNDAYEVEVIDYH